MMHIPIYFPGLTWGPTDVMGHPAWGNLAQWWSTSGWIKILVLVSEKKHQTSSKEFQQSWRILSSFASRPFFHLMCFPNIEVQKCQWCILIETKRNRVHTHHPKVASQSVIKLHPGFHFQDPFFANGQFQTYSGNCKTKHELPHLPATNSFLVTCFMQLPIWKSRHRFRPECRSGST